MKKITYFIRNHFGFSKKETNGFIILLILMSVLLLIPPLVDLLYNPQLKIHSDTHRLDSLISALSHKNEIKEASFKSNPEKFFLFPFNPNDCSKEGLEKIFGKKTASTIIKFREKGGKFFIKEDLLKVYGINERKFLSVKNYILLPDSANRFNSSRYKKEIIAFDINRADTLELKKIKGIGQKLSERIIKYRDKLGGFISEEQYFEVYGLDSTVVIELQKYSFVATDYMPTKINMNTCSYAQLAAHPYMKGKIASVIISYRNQHVRIDNSEQLRKIKVLSEKDFEKILPYLSF